MLQANGNGRQKKIIIGNFRWCDSNWWQRCVWIYVSLAYKISSLALQHAFHDHTSDTIPISFIFETQGSSCSIYENEYKSIINSTLSVINTFNFHSSLQILECSCLFHIYLPPKHPGTTEGGESPLAFSKCSYMATHIRPLSGKF